MENVNIKVASWDTYEEHSEKIYPATKKKSSGGIIYSYDDEYGNSKIFIGCDEVVIFRSGEISAKQKFSLKEETPFRYKTPHLNTTFNLNTEKLAIFADGFEVNYILTQDGSFINELWIHLKEV